MSDLGLVERWLCKVHLSVSLTGLVGVPGVVAVEPLGNALGD